MIGRNYQVVILDTRSVPACLPAHHDHVVSWPCGFPLAHSNDVLSNLLTGMLQVSCLPRASLLMSKGAAG